MNLLLQLEALRSKFAEAAQTVLAEWVQDEEGYDEEFGTGGACDAINSAIVDVIHDNIDGVETLDGGHDGDDHAWTIVHDDVSAFLVDIPPSIYESGGGYSWKKRKNAVVAPDDIVIESVSYRDVVGALVPHLGMVLDLSQVASRVAAINVEAARKKKPARKPKPKSKSKAKSSNKTVLETPTEFACRMELHVEVNFEGDSSRAALVKKLKSEVSAMLEAAVKTTARALDLESSDVHVRPVSIECVPIAGDLVESGDYDQDDD